MPRKTKDTSNNEISKIATAIKEVLNKKISFKEENSSKSNSTKKTATAKTSTAKKALTSKKANTTKKSPATKNSSNSKTDVTKKEATTKTATTTKKATATKKASTDKKASTTKTTTATKKRTSTTSAPIKKVTATKKASTIKPTTAKKEATAKVTTTKKTTSTKKATTTKKKAVTTKRVSKAKKDVEILDRQFSAEYYDLPFRYNQTVVKILAQTPQNLFIYWEISDEDRESLKKQYGEYFFEITKPVLVVHNETLNYSFEVDIDDFANSWYLHVNDSNSEYKIELGRRPIPVNYNYISNYDVNKKGPIKEIQTPYIYISSSNELDAPNDKILFNMLDKVYFRNVKTNEIIEKDIKDFPNIYKNGKFINIYKLYQELYKEEIKNDSFNLLNPSSGNVGSGSFSSRFY